MSKYNIFNEMTKSEIIHWIRENMFFALPPKRSWLMFVRWQKKSQEAENKYQENHEFFQKIDLKKRDEYARKVNESSDIKEKLKYLELMEPFEKQTKEWMDKNKELDKMQAAVDRLYEQIDIERQKENPL